jgi:cyclopropane fatty-acyl-phospholipid synthase-like methyltransferase
VAESWQALEIGCGWAVCPLCRRASRAVGVDLSRDDRPRDYCAGRPASSFTDRQRPRVPEDAFDFVYSHIVFQHLPRKAYVERYFREAARVLRPGGLLRVQVDGRSRQFFRRWIADSWSGVVFSAPELGRRLEREGFDVQALEGAGTQYLRATARRRPRGA